MAGHNPARIQAAHFLDAFDQPLRRAVQNHGRLVDVEKVAGKHVTAEEQIMLRAV